MVSSISSSAVSSWGNALFSKIDSKNKGYIEQSDLQTAFDQIDKTSTAGGKTDVAAMFSQIDSNSDGKVTKDELTTALTKVADQLDSQFNQSRVSKGMSGARPARPAGGDMDAGGAASSGGTSSTSGTSSSGTSVYIAAADTNNDGVVSAEEASAYAKSGQTAQAATPTGTSGADSAGLSKDDLVARLKETGSSDSKRSDLMSKLIDNFDKADSNGDGKISKSEAHAFNRASKSEGADGTNATGAADAGNADSRMLARILELLKSYDSGQNANQSSSTSRLSVSA